MLYKTEINFIISNFFTVSDEKKKLFYNTSLKLNQNFGPLFLEYGLKLVLVIYFT